MLVRIKRVELRPLLTGGAGGHDHSTYGVVYDPEHEQIVAVTEHTHYPTGSWGGEVPPTFTYSAWVIPK